MESTIIWRQIHKLNQKLRLHNLIGLGLTLGFGYLQYPYLRNCYLGPQKIDAAQLLKIKNPREVEREFITFTADKAMDTGFKRVSKSRSRETEENQYVIALVGGEKVLLVEDQIDHDLEKATFTGILSTIQPDIQTQIIEPLLQDAPLLKSKLLPFILETRDYQFGAYFLVPLLLCGSAIFGWNLYKAKIRNQDARKHPLYRSLAEYGDKEQTIKLSESLVDKTIEEIISHAPWAIVGFNDEIKALWDKSREEFYEIVEGRKKQYRNN